MDFSGVLWVAEIAESARGRRKFNTTFPYALNIYNISKSDWTIERFTTNKESGYRPYKIAPLDLGEKILPNYPER